MSERVPIRGPEAEQCRQPQRVQPGGFFRPLFGRSKRGHPDGVYRRDNFTEESTHAGRSSNKDRRRKVHPCRAIPDRVPEDEILCRRKPVANAIGHIDDRAGVLPIRD
jgi:hypothetical protein